MKKAIVLLSGGLDSATTLYLARSQGFQCFCLVFDYGQRHRKEIESAQAIVKSANCKSQIIKINLPWKGSALLDKKIKIPKLANSLMVRQAHHPSNHPERSRGARELANHIPSTYVPGRNIIFLSFALSYAEAIGAQTIFIGANAVDFSGYPDCRPEFYRAFNQVVSSGTKAGVQKRRIKIETPLIDKTKAEIIRLGFRLGVPFALTWSCYRGAKQPCGRCDSCYFRAKGFKEAGIKDPCIRDTLSEKAKGVPLYRDTLSISWKGVPRLDQGVSLRTFER